MSKKNYKAVNRKPSHAGEILRHGFIEQHDLSIETVAQLLGITRQHLSRILNGHNPVTPDIAIRLEVLTQTPASQWLSIQSAYDAYMCSQEKSFKEYKEALDTWSSKSLPMNPEERKKDSKTQKLLVKVSKCAKQFNYKKASVG